MLSHTSNNMNETQTIGVKGSDVYSTTGNELVDFSVMLVRGLSEDEIKTQVKKIISSGSLEQIVDLFVLTYATRNIRGGKGERDLFYCMLHALLLEYSFEPNKEFTKKLFSFIPQFGSWLDILYFADRYRDHWMNMYINHYEELLRLFADQLNKDAATAEGKSISLAAKWAPREKSEPEETKALAKILFPEIEKLSSRLKAYRKFVVGLNKRLHTTEIAMCGKAYSTIVPKEVPGRCMMKNRLAFLNEINPKTAKYHKEMKYESYRYPYDEDRMEAREHFQEFFKAASEGKVRMNGGETVFPHEVVQKGLGLLHSKESSEKDVTNGMWNAIVAKAKELGGLKNCLAMCDFSGSMDGQPKLICTALGLLVAEVSGTNKILTFDSTPTWHQFPEGDLLLKLRSIYHSLGQGLSTDFQKAMELVLDDLVKRRVRPEDVPKDLIVFTDMGWDQACGSDRVSAYTGNSYRRNAKNAPWQTHIEMIRENFRRVGEDMWGVPFVPPRIVIWNLRANYKDFHAKADQEGVVMLSGWSPSLFKVLQEKGVVISTPADALRAQLDDPMYDEVRKVVKGFLLEVKSQESSLKSLSTHLYGQP